VVLEQCFKVVLVLCFKVVLVLLLEENTFVVLSTLINDKKVGPGLGGSI